jgi:hypothetical protein
VAKRKTETLSGGKSGASILVIMTASAAIKKLMRMRIAVTTDMQGGWRRFCSWTPNGGKALTQ